MKLSLETLKNVPEGELTEFIWEAYLNGLDSDTSPGLRIAKLTILFRSELDNGGIRQYITNHTCSPGHDADQALAYVKECLESLKRIGAKESAY